jgi:hypothetical protein
VVETHALHIGWDGSAWDGLWHGGGISCRRGDAKHWREREMRTESLFILKRPWYT